MTSTELRPSGGDLAARAGHPLGGGRPERAFGIHRLPGRPSFDSRRVWKLVAVWTLLALGSLAIVVYALGPVVHQRSQRSLLRSFREQVRRAAGEAQSLGAVTVSDKAPSPGDAVAIVDIIRLHLQQVVVEGVSAAETRAAPGHVPGTAGPGQPGNSAVVGRRSAYGGPFGDLGRLKRGDVIVITSTQGQSVYEVASVANRAVTDAIYAPTRDDRLTLLTSASGWPLATGRATVVVARMKGLPFEPTAQGGRTSTADGRHGSVSSLPSLLIVLGCYALSLAGSIYLYRRWSPLSTYLLTAPVLVAFAIVSAQILTNLLPPWF